MMIVASDEFIYNIRYHADLVVGEFFNIHGFPLIKPEQIICAYAEFVGQLNQHIKAWHTQLLLIAGYKAFGNRQLICKQLLAVSLAFTQRTQLF